MFFGIVAPKVVALGIWICQTRTTNTSHLFTNRRVIQKSAAQRSPVFPATA